MKKVIGACFALVFVALLGLLAVEKSYGNPPPPQPTPPAPTNAAPASINGAASNNSVSTSQQ